MTDLFIIYSRTIYHDNEHEKFLHKLQSRIKLQDKEIEKMCHWQYQGFIDAVRELLQVRGQANSVKVRCLKYYIYPIFHHYQAYQIQYITRMNKA